MSDAIAAGREDWTPIRLRYAVDPRRPITYGIVQCGEDVDDGVPYIRPVDMTDEGGADLGSLRRTAPEIAAAYARSTVRAGDLVVSIGPSFGKVMVVPPSLEGANLTQGTARVAPRAGVSTRFLFWVLRSDWVNRSWAAYCSGATFRALTLELLSDTEFGLPPLPEQRAIAEFLDRETERIDGLIEKKRRLIELLEEKRTALITHAVTRGLDPSVPLKGSGIEWIGQIPEHWEVKRLKHLTTCLDGRRVPLNSEERSARQGDYPYWGANGILDHIDDWLFDEELVLLGEDGAPFFEPHRPVAFRVSGKIWVNNHIHVLRPGRAVDARLLAHVLNCVSYAAFIDGTTRDKLTQDDMDGIPVQLPPVAEQAAIAEFLDRETSALGSVTEAIRQAIAKLQEYRTALISAAVTGKVDVREADRHA